MSVSVIVDDPVTDEQRLVTIPVATESTFSDLWLPASQELGLLFVPLFGNGIVVGEEELDDVLSELSKLRDWTSHQAQTGEVLQMLKRVNRMIDELPEIVSPRTKVYIG